MNVLDELLGRKQTSHTSPKSEIRKIASTESETLTPDQCARIIMAVAAEMSKHRGK